MDRVTKAANRLSNTIGKAFDINPSKATSGAKEAESAIEDISESADKATKSTQDFEEMWEKVRAQHPEWDEVEPPIGEETVEETKRESDEIVQAVEKVEEVVQQANDKGKEIDIGVSEDTVQDVKETEEEVYTLQQRLDACKDHLQSLSQQGMGFGDEEYDNTYIELTKLETELKNYKGELKAAGSEESSDIQRTSKLAGAKKVLSNVCKTAVSGFKKFASVIASAGKQIGSFATKAGKAGMSFASMLNPLKGFHRASDSAGNSITKLGNKILSLAKTALVFSVLRKGFSALGSYMRSMLMTNAQFAASMAQIKGNLLTAFQPIYEACLPAINALASGLATVCGYIAQFTSMLFGKSVSASQVAAKAQYQQVQAYKDTGKAAKKAGKDAKDAQKQLSDIDELHVLNQDKDKDNDTGGSGAGANAPDFTTGIDTTSGVSDFVEKLKEAWSTADFTEIGEILANKLNDALEKIPWENIKNTASKIGSSVATFINGACNVKKLWDTVGKTIGEGINTAIELANSFVTKLDWGNMGESIGRGIDSLLKTVDWNKAADTFSKYYNGIFKAIDSAINAVDWFGAATKIGTAVQNLFTGIDFQSIGATVARGINSITTFFNQMYNQIDFVGLGANIASGLNNMMSNTDFGDLGAALGNALNTAIDSLFGIIHNFDWKGLGQSIADSLNGILKTTNWVELAQGASELVRGLANSLITCIKEFNWEQLGSTIGEMFCTIDWGGIATDAVDLLISAFNALISTLVGIGKTLGKNIIDGLSNGISLHDMLVNAGTWINDHIFKPIVDNFKKLFGIHSPSTVFKDLGGYIMQGLINGITSLVKDAKTLFSTLLSDIKGFFTNIPDWFGKKFSSAFTKIKTAFSLSSIKSFFSGIWSGIKSCFSNVSSWFKNTFSKAWQKVKDVFSTGGKIFSGIKEGIASTFKSVVNALINGINKIIAVPFNKINGMLNSIRNIDIPLIGKPFSGLWSQNPLAVPQIPRLATGTVVPANYGNFMAILGDNKREPEVVSPLSTLEKAVQNVLDRNGGASGGDINLTLELNLDGQKVYSTVRKINRENASAGKTSFALA